MQAVGKYGAISVAAGRGLSMQCKLALKKAELSLANRFSDDLGSAPELEGTR